MIRVNTSRLLSNKELCLFAEKELHLPKRNYLEIIVDFYNKPIGLLYRTGLQEKIHFLNDNQKDRIDFLCNLSARARKQYLKKLLGK